MVNRRLNVAFILLASIVFLAGCTSGKEANKGNFKKAVTEWQQQYGGYMSGTSTLPTALRAEQPPKILVSNFADLSRAGLVDVVLEPASEELIKAGSKTQYKYTLTELGKKHYIPGKGFKIANPEVTEVVEFSPPADDAKLKTKTVNVNYKYKLVPNELGKLINKDAKEEQRDGMVQLALMEKGWTAPKTMEPFFTE